MSQHFLKKNFSSVKKIKASNGEVIREKKKKTKIVAPRTKEKRAESKLKELTVDHLSKPDCDDKLVPIIDSQDPQKINLKVHAKEALFKRKPVEVSTGEKQQDMFIRDYVLPIDIDQDQTKH